MSETPVQYPICEFCSKPIKHTPLLKLDDKDVMLHKMGCPVKLTAKRMADKNYVKAGDQFRMILYSGIPVEKALGGYQHYVNWGPDWAVEFVKLTKRFNNDARHTALHTCASLKDEDKQMQFTNVVKLAGELGLFHFLRMQDPAEICCKRGQKCLKRLERMAAKNYI